MGKYKIFGGCIWKNGHLERNESFSITVAENIEKEVYLQEQDVILPGLVDLHTHLWAPKSELGVSDSELYSDGVVACVDAGSFGYKDWANADRYWKYTGNIKVKSYMSILPEGLTNYPSTNLTDPKNIEVDCLEKAVSEADPETFMGIKVQLGRYGLENDRELMQVAKRVMEDLDCRLMVHISSAYMPLEELVPYMHSGDVITHIYSGLDGRQPLFDANGKIKDIFFEAKKAGIVMDIAHAGKHFSWDVYEKGIAQGAIFDTISTDITKFSWKNKDKFKILDINHLISGISATGIDIDFLFQAVIDNPAKVMGIQLDNKKTALVLKKVFRETEFADGFGKMVKGTWEYKPTLFINENKLVIDIE